MSAQRMSCYECGHSRHKMWVVGDRYVCDDCAERIRDVAEPAASLNLSMYDLVAAVARAKAQIQKEGEVRDYMMNDPAQVYYRRYEYAMRLLSAALDGGDGDE